MSCDSYQGPQGEYMDVIGGRGQEAGGRVLSPSLSAKVHCAWTEGARIVGYFAAEEVLPRSGIPSR